MSFPDRKIGGHSAIRRLGPDCVSTGPDESDDEQTCRADRTRTICPLPLLFPVLMPFSQNSADYNRTATGDWQGGCGRPNKTSQNQLKTNRSVCVVNNSFTTHSLSLVRGTEITENCLYFLPAGHTPLPLLSSVPSVSLWWDCFFHHPLAGARSRHGDHRELPFFLPAGQTPFRLSLCSLCLCGG